MQPSSQPSSQPSNRPGAKPSAPPSNKPGAEPSLQPSVQPTSIPSGQVSGHPSTQPSGLPSLQPVCRPTSQPIFASSGAPTTSTPSNQPSTQPSSQPSLQPVTTPSGQTTCFPKATVVKGEWATILMNASKISVGPISINNSLWACGVDSSTLAGSFCSSLDSALGIQLRRHIFPWADITSASQHGDKRSIAVSGVSVRSYFNTAEMAFCGLYDAQVLCTANSFSDTLLFANSYAPAVGKTVFIGAYETRPLVMVASKAAIQSYLYSNTIMKGIALSHLQSPPNYVGSFFAGTCINSGLIACIFTGVLRIDSGHLTGMYITPVRGSIVNSAELVNAMVLEYVNPDTFVAGGLQLAGETFMHAYLLCTNAIFRQVVFGVRYFLHSAVGTARRRSLLSEDNVVWNSASVAKGMILVEKSLYLILCYKEPQLLKNRGSVALLKIDMATGDIIQQIQIYSPSASMQCTHITYSGAFLSLACTAKYSKNVTLTLVLSVNRDLTCTQLPVGFSKYENSTFLKDPISFKSAFLTLTVQSFDSIPVKYTFTTAEGNSTRRSSLRPTSQPSSAPSGQPSSCPTSAPSVSPQPTSQPSSSGPTNTYQPTVKPTQRPSVAPTGVPTLPPSSRPSDKPTAQPSTPPSVIPCAQKSLRPAAKPTRGPVGRPTRIPSAQQVIDPTTTPTEVPTVTKNNVVVPLYNDQAYAIVGYIVAALFGMWFLYYFRQWCSYKLEGVQSDANRTLYAASMDAKLKPKFPIATFLVSLFVTIEPAEVDFISVENIRVERRARDTPAGEYCDDRYHGVGASADGPSDFRDLEANVSGSNRLQKAGAMNSATQERNLNGDDNSDVDIVLSAESSITNSMYSLPDESDCNSTQSADEEHALELLVKFDNCSVGDYSSIVLSDTESNHLGCTNDSTDGRIAPDKINSFDDSASGSLDDSAFTGSINFTGEGSYYSTQTSALESGNDSNSGN